MPWWLKGLSFLNSILSQFMSKNHNYKRGDEGLSKNLLFTPGRTIFI